MACSNPFYRYNKYSGSYSRIPCGWCISCRIDKRTYFQDRFEFDFFKKFNCVGTFGCITYDDNHLPFGFFDDLPSLRKKHMVDFWKRVRSYMSYHKIDNNLLRKDFKHYTVGEYSDDGRPHYHFIAIGLDYRLAEDLYSKCWDKSVIIDSRPILNGGMSYVLKYLDKQEHGDLLDKYFDAGIEPPFLINSHKVGDGLYRKENLDLTTMTYHWDNKNRPIPPRIRNILNLDLVPFKNIKVRNFLSKNGGDYDSADKYIRQSRNEFFEHRMTNNNEPVNRVQEYPDTNKVLEIRGSLIR